MTARAQRNEGRAAEHQRDRAAGGEAKIIAAALCGGDNRKGVLAGEDQRLIAKLQPRVGLRHARRKRRPDRLLPRAADRCRRALRWLLDQLVIVRLSVSLSV